jgi:hypothetical protein
MGCNSNQDGLINDEELVDSLNFENWMDASITEDELSVDIVSNDPDVQEAHAEIVKKYGEQWDFCTCIVKSDSVNTALMEAPDALFDKVMERSEYIDSKCKGLLIQPNATPEERAKHEKRVKKCLKEAK